MNKQTVRDIDVQGKRILVRVDYNVPVKNGVVGDTARIRASFETLNYLLERGCSLVLISHLGEPKGARDAAFSLAPVAVKAAELLGKPIEFVPDCIGPEVAAKVAALQPGQIVLLENLRFHQEELDNDPEFAKQLAAWGEIFVNDAFAVEHRKQASVVGIPKYLPAVAGFLVEKEVDTVTEALNDPKRPLVAIIGGSKVSTKIEILNNLLPKVDALFVGGAMANTFLSAEGLPVGKSLYEPDYVDTAKKLIEQARDKDIDLMIPHQLVVSKSFEKAENVRTVKAADVADDDFIMDLGPEFAEALSDELAHGGTVIWNGPVGLFEIKEFGKGSLEVAKAVADSSAKSIIGGGDTAAFVEEAGMHDKFGWVSTGGGASLELMSGKTLPGVEALRDK
jgi:phosphoglycerate kinase